MLVLLVVGTFAILSAGSSVRPVRDLAGTWRVIEGPGERIHVRQSGLFLRVALDDSGELRLRWEERGGAPGDEGALLGEMVGDELALSFFALPEPDPSEADAARRNARVATHRLEARGRIEASWLLERDDETAGELP